MQSRDTSFTMELVRRAFDARMRLLRPAGMALGDDRHWIRPADLGDERAGDNRPIFRDTSTAPVTGTSNTISGTMRSG